MAKIDVSKIEGYDSMTLEDKLKALEGFEYEDGATLIERQKNAISRANSEAAEWKRKHNALLSDDEKLKQEVAEKLASMEKELADNRREKLVFEHKAQFIALGYDESLAADSALALVDGEVQKVFANQKKFLELHDRSMKADLMKQTPTPPAGGNGGYTTKSEIMKIKDGAERRAAIANNIELFKEG